MPTEHKKPLVELLAQIGLEADFIEELFVEGDWSFVIKLHALFESLIGSLILEELGRNELDDVVAYMGFNDSKSGKVVTARALGLLTTSEKTFLTSLSTLRNKLVHNVEQTSFKFTGLDEKSKNDFAKKFALPPGLKNLQTNEPKMVLLASAYEVMLGLHYRRSKTKKSFLIAALRDPQRSAIKTSVNPDA